MAEEFCLLCGGPLRRRPPWWARLIGLTPPPVHDPKGPGGRDCWSGFNRRMGLDPDRPMPDERGGA